jgi:hypothetical protein
MTAPDLLVLLHDRADALPPVTLTPTGPMRVPFTGSRGGDGPLTITQATTLSWVTKPIFPTRMVEWPLPLSQGTTLADIAAALEILMARHESLRTCYPDGSTQRVARSGELVVDVYAASAEPADDAVLVTELAGRLRSREFDLAAELPLRAAVVVWQGVPRAVVILYSHMAADFAAMSMLEREFVELVSNPSSRQVGPARHQPLDQAAAERSARGGRRQEAAVRGWETALRIKPQCVYAVPAADPRHCGGVVSGWLWSRAGALALPHITARTGTSRQLVVFTALCTMVAWRTGHDPCVVHVLATNRYERSLRDYIGTLVQDSIVSVDSRAQRFDEVVRRAAAAVLRGNRSSLIEVSTLERLVARMDQQRGIFHVRYCTFNDISVFAEDASAADAGTSEPAGDPDEARQALGQTRFAQLPAPGEEEQLLQILLQQVDGELIIGTTTRDANRVPLGELETLLRGVESLLVAAAADDVELSRLGEITGVEPIARGPGWVHIDHSWIELTEVQRLVEDALPAPAAVFAVPDPSAGPHAEPILVAYLTSGVGIGTPRQAHAACLATLAGTRTLVPPGGIRYTAITPARYVICASAPADHGDLAAWRQQPVVAEGDGRVK